MLFVAVCLIISGAPLVAGQDAPDKPDETPTQDTDGRPNPAPEGTPTTHPHPQPTSNSTFGANPTPHPTLRKAPLPGSGKLVIPTPIHPTLQLRQGNPRSTVKPTPRPLSRPRPPARATPLRTMPVVPTAQPAQVVPTPTAAPSPRPVPTLAPEDMPIADSAPGEPPPVPPRTVQPGQAKPGPPTPAATAALSGKVTSTTPIGQATPLPPPGLEMTPVPGAATSKSRSNPGAGIVTPSDHSTTTAAQQEELPDPGAAYDFMQQALYAGVLVALMCSYLGIFVVLKRIVFVGVALSEMSSAGIALMIFLARYSISIAPALHLSQERVDDWFSHDAPLIGALLFMLLGVALFSVHWSPRRVPHDSYIGILYSIAGAVAILLIATSAQGEGHMLTLLQGDVLTVDAREVLEMLGVFVVVGLIHLLFGKEFLLVSFDRESAATLGFRAGAWDMLLFLTIGVVIAFSIHSVGILMTSSMLILPASTALLVTHRLKHAMLLAPLLGALSVIIGLRLPAAQHLPSSAVIVLLSFIMLLPALAFNALRQRV